VTTARKADPIRRMTTNCGETRCRFVIDVGKRPSTGSLNCRFVQPAVEPHGHAFLARRH
jgi:hypothetical protein